MAYFALFSIIRCIIAIRLRESIQWIEKAESMYFLIKRSTRHLIPISLLRRCLGIADSAINEYNQLILTVSELLKTPTHTVCKENPLRRLNSYDAGDESSTHEFYKSEKNHGFQEMEVLQVRKRVEYCNWKLKYIDLEFFKGFFKKGYLGILYSIVSSAWTSWHRTWEVWESSYQTLLKCWELA